MTNSIDYVNFYNWAIKTGYKEGLTIERIDVNGDYEPSNCKWILMSEQVNNTRRCVFIEYNGEKLNINQWAKKLGINKNTFWRYVRVKNMTIAEIIQYVKCRD